MSTTIYGLSVTGRLECFGGKRTVFSKRLFRTELGAWADKYAFVERVRPGDGALSFTAEEFDCHAYELEDE